jgi:G:T/U-mismatch repair DNA glycosylase
MTAIRHRFLEHKINPETETLVIGTFNPDTTDNKADFFYGRGRNYLWRFLSSAFGSDDLKIKSKNEKLDFIHKYKIDFIDLISEAQLDSNAKYDDIYLDSRVIKWREIIVELENLKNIKRVCFTRKSFDKIPEIKYRIETIQKYCEKNNIPFKYLTTPARPPKYYGTENQKDWTNFFNNGN